MQNDDLIESIESRPDTTITLVNGKKIIVKESLEEVFQKVLEFRKVSFASLGALAKWVGQNKSQSQETKESGCDAC